MACVTMQPTRRYRFRPCLMLVYDDRKLIDTLFYQDASVVRFDVQHWYDADPASYIEGARLDGYGDDWWTKAVHHDWCHAYLADKLGQPYSLCLWRGAHGLNDPTPETEEEERRVVAFQRFLMTPDNYASKGWHRLRAEALELLG